jgi:hypothetical protein
VEVCVSAVLALIAARARAYAGQWALVALGVAIAAAVPVLSSASTRVASSGALEHAIAELPAGQRSVTVSYNGYLRGAELQGADQAVRTELRQLSTVSPLRQMVFRRLSDGHGSELTLGAADHLDRAVRLVSGHLPASCTPQRCEVVMVGAGGTPDTASLGVVVVGHVDRVNPFLLSGTFDPGLDAPLLLGANTEQMAASQILENFQRSWGWVTPLDLAIVGRLGVSDYLARGNDVGDELMRRLQGLIVTAPDDILRSEDERARRSGQRFGLLGGTSAALVLGLAVVAAVSTRWDHLAVIRLLLTRGATPGQLAGFTFAEATWPVLAGGLLGVGTAYVGALAVSGPDVAAAGLAGGAGTAALLTVAAAVAVGLTLRWSPAAGERAAWQMVTFGVAVTVGAALLAASRGAAAIQAGASTDPLVSLLPVLAALAGGLLAARCWPLLPRLLARVVPRRAPDVRLALAGAGRRPLRAAVTVAVVAATSASVIFALGYRTTLDRGAEDQAGFAVPMVARLTTGTSLTRPADVSTPALVAALGPGATAYPVLRTGATVDLTAADAAPVELLGLAPSALPRMAPWRSDYADAARSTVQRRLAVPAPVRGPAIPDGARRLSLPAVGSTFRLDVIALVRDSSGRSLPITLARRGNALAGDLPAGTGRSLEGLTLREDMQTASLRQHAVGEGGVDLPARTGTVVVGPPSADGRPLGADLRAWSVPAPGAGEATDTGLAIHYRIAGDTTTAQPSRPAAGPLPAYVDGATASRARGGLLSLGVGQGKQLAVRVVARGDRFPTTRGRFAVVDRAALAAVLDETTPGAGTATEVWVWAPPGGPSRAVAQGLKRGPFDLLTVDVRQAREDALRTDPVAVTASRLLLGTALVGLVVGGLCVVLLVLAERRESAGELFAREADGTRPARLRLELLGRAAAVLALGVPVGVATGIALARATTTLVAVTAGGTTPEPPLASASSPGLVLLALVALLGLGLAGAAGVAATSLRGALPVPPGTDLR